MLIIPSKATVHPVAKSFFNKVRAGGGDVADKKPIIDFTKRLSKIIHPSLWVCWPLRQQHNIGFSTTAFSLGGLANANGTLFNGPTWQPDGMNLIGSSGQRMTALNVNANVTSGVSIFCIATGSASQGAFSHLLTWQASSYFSGGSLFLARGSSTFLRAQAAANSSTVAFMDTALFNVTSSSFMGVAARVRSGGNLSVAVPNTTPSETAASAFSLNADRMVIGTRDSDAGSAVCWTGKVAFVLACASEDAYLLNSAIYNLYKQTLGVGLGLA